MSSPAVTPPVFEHHHSGLGIDVSRPRISWKFQSCPETARAWWQTAYELEITFTTTQEEPQLFRVSSNESVLVPWPARPLVSRESATVRIRAFGRSLAGNSESDNNATILSDVPSSWSESSYVEAALLHTEDFKANFITTTQPMGPPGPLQPLRFRRHFSLPSHISKGSRARLYITALGVYEAWLNGKRVGDEVLAPGWTSYKHRLAYRVLDVTDMIDVSRSNVLAIEVAEGWYAGRLGFNGGQRFRYGDKIGLFAQLEVGEWSLVTDQEWMCAPSPIILSELYDGEIYDARKEDHDWTQLGADEAGASYNPTTILPWPTTQLVAPDMPPIRVTETKPCQAVFRSASGKTILDFGQNLVGKLQVQLPQLSLGVHLTFRHAEVMEQGELGTRPLRQAKAQDTVIGTGDNLGIWTPKFTFHGFRYVQVDGWPDDRGPTPDRFEALVVHTDMARRGTFECSNKSVNQLHQNVVWSMRGNFVSLPTDCPQRDERLGWTGDLQVFAPTASFLYDTTSLLSNWLQDVAAEQLEAGKGGIPPLVVPTALSSNWPHMAQAIWDDVTVLTPNVLFQYSADKGLLQTQFASMRAWLDEGVDRAPDGLWNPDRWQLADWLDPSAPPQDPGNGRTDSILVANAYLIHTTRIFARICSILNENDLAEKYTCDAAQLLELFQRRYITAEGYLMSCSQTGLALAIQFDLYPRDSPMRRTAALALDRLVRTARFHISTGFAGTPVIAHALTKLGKSQLAYRMLLETTCPSWLYPITMGATTIWERWDSMLPNGNINPGEMTSFNHYALGAVADWLHSSVGGISPLKAGWRKIRVRPVPGGNITSARVRFHGPYGLVSCEWALNGEGINTQFWMKIIIPPNCSALVTLPCDLTPEFFKSVENKDCEGQEEKAELVYSGTHEFACPFVADEWPPKPLVAAYQPLPPLTIAE